MLVGLLGSRYGKGITEAEYDRACDLNLPVLMYVRDPNAPIVPAWVDSEPDLVAHNKAFREKVEKAWKRDVFATSAELRGHVLRDLGYTVSERFLNGTRHAEPGRSEQLPGTPVPSSEPIAQQVKPPGRSDLEHLLQAVSAKLGDLGSLDGQIRRRFYLFAAGIFYGAELNGTLGNHEIHLLYRDRATLTPVWPEFSLMMRTLCADESSTSVGWFWARKLGNKRTRDYLAWLCLNSPEDDVRRGAMGFLAGFPTRATEKVFCENATAVGDDVSVASLEILERLGTSQCLPILDQVESEKDDPVKSAVRKAKLSVLSRIDPEKAIEYVCAVESIERAFDKTLLTEIMAKVSNSSLNRAKGAPNALVAVLATRELLQRDLLDDAELHSLIKSKDARLRCAAYEQLLSRGTEFDVKQVRDAWDEVGEKDFGFDLLALPLWSRSLRPYGHLVNGRDDITIKILATYSKERLWELINEWLDPVSSLAYLAWGLRGGREALPQIREDLSTSFQRIRSEYMEASGWLNDNREKVINEPGKPQVRVLSLIESWSRYDKQSIVRFTQVCLKLLLSFGEGQDVDISLKYIDDADDGVKHLARTLLVKLADERHISQLVEISLSAEATDIRRDAGQKALTLAMDRVVSERFIESSSATLVRLAMQDKLRRREILEHDKINSLLQHQRDGIREVTVAYLCEAFKSQKRRLETILNDYLGGTSYYYDVVCWLDRILYAPPALKLVFRKQIGEKLKENEK